MTGHPSAHDRLGGRSEALALAWRNGLADAPGVQDAEALVATLVDALLVEEPDLRDFLVRRTATVAAPSLDALTALRPLLHRAAPDPASAEHLHRALDVLVRVLVDRTVDEWAAVALVDPLTGAGNRRALEEQLHQHVARAVRHERPLSVVTVDLDGLKRINDTAGHPAGDDAIRRLAQGLRDSLRAGDSVFRIGGDEFVVVLPETDRHAAVALLRRAQDVSPAFSYGVAALPEDEPDAAPLLAASDARLLDSKRGRRSVASTEARAAAVRRRMPIVLPVLVGLVLAEFLRRAVAPDLAAGAMAVWLGASAAGGIVLASHVAAGTSAAVLGATRTVVALAAAATLLPAAVAADRVLDPSTTPHVALPTSSTSATTTTTSAVGPRFALPPVPQAATVLPRPAATTPTSSAQPRPTTASTSTATTTTTRSVPLPDPQTLDNGRRTRTRAHGDPDPGWRRHG